LEKSNFLKSSLKNIYFCVKSPEKRKEIFGQNLPWKSKCFWPGCTISSQIDARC